MKTRKLLAFFTVITMLLALSTVSVGASASQLTASWNYENEKLTINGSNAAINGLISVYVLGASVDAETINDLNKPAIVDAFMANETGGFAFEILLPSALTTGQYKINIASGANTWESPVFNHINSGELASLVYNINSSANATEIESWLTPLNIALQLPNISYTSEFLFAVRPTGGFTDTTLQTEMQRSTALCLLQQGKTPEELVSYSEYLKDETLKIDCLEQYKNMTAAVKTEYLTTVAGMNLKKTTALEDIYGAGLIESASAAASWQGLRNIIQGETQTTEFFTKKIAAGTVFDSLTYPDVVYQELYRQKASITDMTALKALFSTAATNCKNAEDAAAKEEEDNTPPVFIGGGGGSGGGGGGGISSWGPNASETIKDIENANDNKPQTDPKPDNNKNNGSSFDDIKGHWGENAIKEMIDLGVVSGYPDGSFRPDAAVSRAEYVKMLCVLFGIEPASTSSFADVKATDWYAPYVEAAAAAKIVQGDESGKFNPDATVTRQDAAVILGRFLKLTEISADGKFVDGKNISDYASGYVAAMADAGLINGVGDGKYAPLNDTTRAQTVTMLLNAKNWTDNGGAK